MNARVSIIISGPFVNDPTTIDLLLARIPDDRNGVPPLIVEASMFTPRILQHQLDEILQSFFVLLQYLVHLKFYLVIL